MEQTLRGIRRTWKYLLIKCITHQFFLLMYCQVPLCFFWQKAEHCMDGVGYYHLFPPSREGEDEKFLLQVLALRDVHLGALGCSLWFLKKVYMADDKLCSENIENIVCSEGQHVTRTHKKGVMDTAVTNTKRAVVQRVSRPMRNTTSLKRTKWWSEPCQFTQWHSYFVPVCCQFPIIY